MLRLGIETSYPQIMVLFREKLQHQGKYGIKTYKLQDMPEWKLPIFSKGQAKQEEKS